jgi:hypothetical protein
VTGLGIYPDGMVEHDGSSRPTPENSSTCGIADNTIVMWSTDHGVEPLTWPDAGTTPFQRPCAHRFSRRPVRERAHRINRLQRLALIAGEIDFELQRVSAASEAGRPLQSVLMTGDVRSYRHPRPKGRGFQQTSTHNVHGQASRGKLLVPALGRIRRFRALNLPAAHEDQSRQSSSQRLAS